MTEPENEKKKYERYEYSVIDVCLRIYGSMSGTSDAMTEAETEKLLS